MATERLRQQVELLLDEAQEAVTGLDWTLVRDRAKAALSIDQENADGLALLAIAERELGDISAQAASPSLALPSEQRQIQSSGTFFFARTRSGGYRGRGAE